MERYFQKEMECADRETMRSIQNEKFLKQVTEREVPEAGEACMGQCSILQREDGKEGRYAG